MQIDQDFDQQLGAGLASPVLLSGKRDNHVKTSATLNFDTGGNFPGGTQTGTPSQSCTCADPAGACYSRTVTAQNNQLSAFTSGKGCQFGFNYLPDVCTQFASQSAGATVTLLP